MRLLASCVLLAAALAAASCVRPTPVPTGSEMLIVTGRGYSDELARLDAQLGAGPDSAQPAGQTFDPSWARQDLTAKGTGTPPSYSSSTETRRLMAKRQAVGAAWRDLAGQLQALKTPDGRTVGDYAARSEKIRARVEELARNANLQEESEKPDGSVEVTMSLRVDPLGELVPPQGGFDLTEEAPVTSETRAEWQRLREKAREDAERDARAKIIDAIAKAPIGRGRTIGQKTANDPELAAQLRTMAEAAETTTPPRFKGDGSCELDIPFDLANAKRLAIQRW